MLQIEGMEGMEGIEGIEEEEEDDDDKCSSLPEDINKVEEGEVEGGNDEEDGVDGCAAARFSGVASNTDKIKKREVLTLHAVAISCKNWFSLESRFWVKVV